MNRRRFLFAAAAGAANPPTVKFVPRGTVACPPFAIPIIVKPYPEEAFVSAYALIERKMLLLEQNMKDALARSFYTGGQNHEDTGWRFAIDRRFLAGGTDTEVAAAPADV